MLSTTRGNEVRVGAGAEEAERGCAPLFCAASASRRCAHLLLRQPGWQVDRRRVARSAGGMSRKSSSTEPTPTAASICAMSAGLWGMKRMAGSGWQWARSVFGVQRSGRRARSILASSMASQSIVADAPGERARTARTAQRSASKAPPSGGVYSCCSATYASYSAALSSSSSSVGSLISILTIQPSP